MANARSVPGTDYQVRAISAGEMMELERDGVDGIPGLIKLAQLATINGDGNRVWATEEDAQAAPWIVIRACADEALLVNEFADDDPSGN